MKPSLTEADVIANWREITAEIDSIRARLPKRKPRVQPQYSPDSSRVTLPL